MQEPSVRIGNKDKSVRVKEYMLHFYAEMMGLDFDDAKDQAEKILAHGLEIMPSRMVTADYVQVSLLQDVSLNRE